MVLTLFFLHILYNVSLYGTSQVINTSMSFINRRIVGLVKNPLLIVVMSLSYHSGCCSLPLNGVESISRTFFGFKNLYNSRVWNPSPEQSLRQIKPVQAGTGRLQESEDGLRDNRIDKISSQRVSFSRDMGSSQHLSLHFGYSGILLCH